MGKRYTKITAEVVGVDNLTYRDNRDRREGQGQKSEICLLLRRGEQRGTHRDRKRVAQNK